MPLLRMESLGEEENLCEENYWKFLEQGVRLYVLCPDSLKNLLLYQAARRNHPCSSGHCVLGIDVFGKIKRLPVFPTFQQGFF